MIINIEKKLFESELKIMEIVWEHEPISAGNIAILAIERYGWCKNTAYTVTANLVVKGVIARTDPGFICTAVMKKQDAVKAETDTLLRHFYGGAKKALISALIEDENLNENDITELKELISKK
ncbi:MAG: BlaI/MecI/CopY family transcriptional regulator [Clostridia bacterium]|nr:BlaI/MecI/CopY family transcriptional regulator [Clostridia bacterium]